VKAAGGVLICSRVFSAHRPGTHRGRRRLSCKGLVGGGALDTPGARPVWAYGGWRCNGQPQVVKGRGSIVAAVRGSGAIGVAVCALCLMHMSVRLPLKKLQQQVFAACG